MPVTEGTTKYLYTQAQPTPYGEGIYVLVACVPSKIGRFSVKQQPKCHRTHCLFDNTYDKNSNSVQSLQAKCATNARRLIEKQRQPVADRDERFSPHVLRGSEPIHGLRSERTK